MDPRLKSLQRALRDAVHDADDEANGEKTARSAAQRALSAWESRRPKRTFAVFAALASVVVVGIFVLFFARRPASLSFSVGSPTEPGTVGAWMAAPSEGLVLSFSDGSEISLQGGASARIVRIDERGANVLLERGTLIASVVHKGAATDPKTAAGDASGGTHWSVDAGPFRIHVVGTRFDAAWEPAKGSLTVSVREGRVFVTGPLLGDGQFVGADEKLRVSLQTSRFEMTRAPSLYATVTEPQNASAPVAISTADPGAPSPNAPMKPEPSAAAAPTGSSAPASSAANRPQGADWRELARKGRHQAAVSAAVASGYDAVLAGASQADLLLLADSARFVGETARARDALLAARKRGAKGSTAFLLGKIAADGAGSRGEAARWFETYLVESPAGGLEEQALGRLIEIYKRSGQIDKARASATKVLEKYPGGGYANAARAVIEP